MEPDKVVRKELAAGRQYDFTGEAQCLPAPAIFRENLIIVQAVAEKQDGLRQRSSLLWWTPRRLPVEIRWQRTFPVSNRHRSAS